MDREETIARVRRGVKRISDRDPNWSDEVSARQLDMGDCGACVLGQWAGDYAEGRVLLYPGVSETEADMLAERDGFYVTPGVAMAFYYRCLTSAWRDAIRAAQRELSAPAPDPRQEVWA
jgi:hypothetical protein